MKKFELPIRKMWFIFPLLCILAGTVSSTVVFSTTDGELCPNQQVQYECTVSGIGFLILGWRVHNDDGGQFGSSVSYLSSNIGQTSAIGGEFTVTQTSANPITSTVSFTAKPSFDGFTITCEDRSFGNEEIYNIEIAGLIGPPSAIILSLTSTDVSVTWTPPSFTSQCVNVSSYSITSNATNSIITTTDTSVDIPLAGLSPGVYCVSVATVDTANRTGEYSNEECAEIKAPLILPSSTTSPSSTTLPSSTVIRLSTLIPLSSSQLTTSTTTTLNEMVLSTHSSSSTANTVFVSAVTVENCHCTYDCAISTTINVMSQVRGTTSVKGLSESGDIDCSTSINSSTTTAVIISVAITVPVTAVITAIITVIILYLYQRRVNKQSFSKSLPTVIPIVTNEVDVIENTAYGQIQH